MSHTSIRILVAVILITLPCVVDAQEFWLRPDKIRYKAGDSVKVMFITGENFNGHRWPLTNDKIEKLELYQSNNILDLKPAVKETAKFQVAAPSQSEGTKLLALQTTGDLVTVDVEKFNTSLREDGLEDIISARAKNGTSNNPAKEHVMCYAKLLVEAGNVRDETFKKNVGFPIEIMPDRDPCLLKKGDVLHLRILFQGKPLFGAKVRIWNYYDHLTTTQNIYTQQDGTIEMTISGSGSWLINVVKMIPLKSADAEWQCYRGSLTFSIK